MSGWFSRSQSAVRDTGWERFTAWRKVRAIDGTMISGNIMRMVVNGVPKYRAETLEECHERTYDSAW